MRLRSHGLTFAGVALPDLVPPPRVDRDRVVFTQTAGGHTGAPVPRPMTRPPFWRLAAPVAWITLTLRADGTSAARLTAASPFPRHYLYDSAGRLIQKSALIRYKDWLGRSGQDDDPWTGGGAPVPVTPVRGEAERSLGRVSWSMLRPPAAANTRHLAWFLAVFRLAGPVAEPAEFATRPGQRWSSAGATCSPAVAAPTCSRQADPRRPGLRRLDRVHRRRAPGHAAQSRPASRSILRGRRRLGRAARALSPTPRFMLGDHLRVKRLDRDRSGPPTSTLAAVTLVM